MKNIENFPNFRPRFCLTKTMQNQNIEKSIVKIIEKWMRYSVKSADRWFYRPTMLYTPWLTSKRRLQRRLECRCIDVNFVAKLIRVSWCYYCEFIPFAYNSTFFNLQTHSTSSTTSPIIATCVNFHAPNARELSTQKLT